jgi:hypothetical protein
MDIVRETYHEIFDDMDEHCLSVHR